MNLKKPNSKKIAFTGGGTAGHVIPNLVIYGELNKSHWSSFYVGSKKGIEFNLVGDKMPFFHVSSGKLRRYFDFKNFTDIFKIGFGVLQSFFLLLSIRPDVIFSKGGFVSVPVVFSGWILRIPIVIHEADITPGLANKLTKPFAKKICVAFEETLKFFPGSQTVHTGIPIRGSLFQGDKNKGFDFSGFDSKIPVILVMGGSLGADAVNQVVRSNLDQLTENFQVIHLCGKGKSEPKLNGQKKYKQFEFVDEELPHFLAIADLVISRAGANSIFELLALKKPNLLIPLSLKASRGDQILNANSFKSRGFSIVLEEQDLNSESLIDGIQSLYQKREDFIQKMGASQNSKSEKIIKNIIEDLVN